ncbi:unnamed protein product [Strongylus vulgaris]|uniref:Uncharacterized protein n=1 Tax=Strongylus vulgaris TaxID=40348 RepID=A0A3P7I1C3_STRVU|nr:unnamed protein product [Strongylus vulgaris]
MNRLAVNGRTDDKSNSPMARRSHSISDIPMPSSLTLKSSELSFSCDIPQAAKFGVCFISYYFMLMPESQVARFDPCPPEERMKSLQNLLAHIYHEESAQSSTRDLTDSLTESFQSDVSFGSPKRHTSETLDTLGDVTRCQKTWQYYNIIIA